MDKYCADKKLVDILKEKDPELYNQLEKIKEKGMNDWIGLMGSDKGSHNGYPHLRNVERNADRIIPDYIKYGLSGGELFLLLSAIFMHDIGKINTTSIPYCHEGMNCDIFSPDDNTSQTVINSNKYPYNSDKNPPCCKPIWDHNRKSQQILSKIGVSLGLPDEHMAYYCGLLSYCHGLRKPPYQDEYHFYNFTKSKGCENTIDLSSPDFRNTSVSPFGLLRIPLLASVLRIADETDHNWNRSMNDWELKLFNNENVKENLYKTFRKNIEDVEFCHSGQCIILHVSKFLDEELSPNVRKSINRARKEIEEIIIDQENKISKWGEILIDHGIIFKGVYIEYGDQLFLSFDNEELYQPQPLEKIIPDQKDTINNLFKASVNLVQGSHGYDKFTWQALEAKVGKPLSTRDKWLALNIHLYNHKNESVFSITPDPTQDILQIKISIDKLDPIRIFLCDLDDRQFLQKNKDILDFIILCHSNFTDPETINNWADKYPKDTNEHFLINQFLHDVKNIRKNEYDIVSLFLEYDKIYKLYKPIENLFNQFVQTQKNISPSLTGVESRLEILDHSQLEKAIDFLNKFTQKYKDLTDNFSILNNNVEKYQNGEPNDGYEIIIQAYNIFFQYIDFKKFPLFEYVKQTLDLNKPEDPNLLPEFSINLLATFIKFCKQIKMMNLNSKIMENAN